MASQEEDNKLECFSNVNKEQERYYLNVYKKYETILNDKSEKFENKVQSLIEVWKSISELNFSQFDIKYVIQIIDWAKLHALNIVLTGEWRSTKECFRDSLLDCIEKAQGSLASVNDAFSTRCQKLADVVKKPWEDPVLYNLIQERDAEIGSKEIEFFCVETAYLVSVRLKKLCENHCEDLALNLVTNFLKYKKQAAIQNFNLNATETQLWFIFDIYIALLYKFQDKTKILEQFEDLQLKEGVQLIKRFAKKRVKISKIWRNCHKIAIFGSRFFLSKALMKYSDELKGSLMDLLKTYLTLSNTESLLQEFVVSVRNLTNLADAEGLCIMCEVIHTEGADKLRHFAIEMYIRALTTDMNELERLKHVNEDEKMKLTTSRLAHTFSNLAELLDDHVKVARECILTAFSLEPTKERLKKIEELAKRSGFPVLDTGQEWKCRLHPPILPSDDLAWVCPECGEWMCKPELTAPLQLNTPLQEALQESVLGISEALCDDLVVCLSNPRYQILNWLLSWGDLYRLCILYLNDPEKTKNFVTELKFVDVDYSMFEHIKREPVDEYTGIEKGYEQYLDLDFVSDEETSSVSEDSTSHDRSIGLGSDGTGESYIPLPQPKSDPNTLKSLRMFRPSLKRKKEDPEPLTKDKKMASSTHTHSSSSALRCGDYSSFILPAKPDNTYMPQVAEVTTNILNSSSSLISTVGNFSSCVKTSASTSVTISEAPKSYSVTGSIHQPVNSALGTTNLSSVTSTSYVSNIIKSGLTFGVPKISTTVSSTVSLQTNVSVHNHGPNNMIKQSVVSNSRQNYFIAPSTCAKKNTTHTSSKYQSSFASPSNVQRSLKAAGKNSTYPANSTKTRTVQGSVMKNSSHQVSSSVVSDLDALLREVVKDIDKDSDETIGTESKNGVAATLPQLGGQVASNQMEPIQVPQQQSHNLCQTQAKSPPGMFSHNGTNDVCRTRLRSSSNPEQLSYSGVTSNPTRKRKQTIESIKAISHGTTTFKLMDLRVKIPRLNLEKYNIRGSQLGGNKLKTTKTKAYRDNMPKHFSCQPATVQLKQLIVRLKPLIVPLALAQVQPKVAEDIVQTEPLAESPTNPNSTVESAPTKTVSLPTALNQSQQEIQQRQFLKPELSIHHQDKSQLQTEVPLPSTVEQIKTVPPRESPTSPCPKEQCYSPQKEVQADSQTPSQEFPSVKILTEKKSYPLPLRLDNVIIIPREKVKELLSLASFAPGACKATIKSSQLHAICQRVQKKEEQVTSIAMSRTVLEISSRLPNQIKIPTICLDSSKSQAITVSCDKDKIQDGNKKTDLNSIRAVQELESEKTEKTWSSDGDNCFCPSGDKKNSYVIKQITDEWEDSTTTNMIDSIMVDNNLTSDRIFPNKPLLNVDSETNVDVIKDSVNNAVNYSTTKKTIDNVHKTLNCDTNKKTDLHASASREPLNCDSDETLARIEEWLEEAVKWNTKDTNRDKEERSFIETDLENDLEFVNKKVDVTPQGVETYFDQEASDYRGTVAMNSNSNILLSNSTIINSTQGGEEENTNLHIKFDERNLQIDCESTEQVLKNIETLHDLSDSVQIERNTELICSEITNNISSQILSYEKSSSSMLLSNPEVPTDIIINKPVETLETTEVAEDQIQYENVSDDSDCFIINDRVPNDKIDGAAMQSEQCGNVHQIINDIIQNELSVSCDVDSNKLGSRTTTENAVTRIKEDSLKLSLISGSINNKITIDLECATDSDNFCLEPTEQLLVDDVLQAHLSDVNMNHTFAEVIEHHHLSAVENQKLINEIIVESECSKDAMDVENLTGEHLAADKVQNETNDTNTPHVSEIKDNLQQTVHSNQEIIREKFYEAECSDSNEKHTIEDQVNRFFENNRKELRIMVEKRNFINYLHNYCQKSKDKSNANDCSDQSTFKRSRLILKDPLRAAREAHFRRREKLIKERNSFYIDKENIKRSPDESVIGSQPYIDQNVLYEDYCYRRLVSFFDGPLDFTFMNCPPEQLKSFRGGDWKPRNSGVKIYSNTRKRKHNDVPCFKLDQEKNSHKSKDRRLMVALKRLPEVIARPNVTVLVSDPFKSDEERIDGDIYKKTSPLVDCNVRNDANKNPNGKYQKKRSNKRKSRKLCGKKSDSTKDDEDKHNLGKNYGIHVHIYEDKFYSMIAKVYRPLGRSGVNEPVSFRIPGLNDYSEILPRNVNHVVNVVQHSVSRSSTVTNQNTQTSTQVTPHIQRIGQPKVPDRKPDHFEDEAEPSSSTNNSTPSTSQSSTLINILSSHKPGQKSVQSRQAPFVNILSQQIFRPCPEPSTATVIKVEPEDHAEEQTAKTVNTNVRIVTTATQAGAPTTTSTPAQGGTILQFICKSSLPKFQQAFGKTVYQTGGSTEGTSETSGAPTNENSNQTQQTAVVETKKIAAKALPVNVQPIAGNVIFRGQVPVGQTVSLIPPGSNTRQLFRITGSTHEQISLVKETVIQNKMSALLAAALQGKPKITEQNGELVEEYSATRITLCRPGSVPPNATRIVKPVQLQIPANVIRAPQPNVSSTTLEQLREFDMVYKQVKERSSNPTQPETSTQSSQESAQQQRISFTYVNQVQKYTQLSPVVVVSSYSPIQQSVSPASSVTSQCGSGPCLTQVSTVTVPKVAVKSSKGKSIKSTVAKTSPTTVPAIPKPQQKPQEDEHTTQRIFDILAEYAEQLRNSPDLNNKPAPRRRSNPPTNPSSSASASSSSKKKKKKSNSSSTNSIVETDNEDLTMGSEDSSGGNVVQLSMTDEEQSQSASITPPESNLEPATSNPSTPRPLIVTDSSNQPRNVIITDSSVGEAIKMPSTALLMPGNYLMPVSVVKGGQQIAVVSGGSKILTTVPTRSGQNMLLFQSFVNQNKKGGISTVKYSTLQPFSGITSQNVSGVSGQSPVVLPSNSVATVALGQPITLKKIDDSDRANNTELLLAISQPRDSIKMDKAPDIPQPDSSTNLSCEAIEVKIEEGSPSDCSSNGVFNNIQKTNSVATSVIASVIKKDENERSNTISGDSSIIKVEESSKPVERVGSVLVNASSSNGPMLSHTNTRYRKSNDVVDSASVSTNHNSAKVPQSGAKILKNNAIYYAIRTKKAAVSKKIDSEMQKQAAMERELRLQKSLSEECEDLGVDEPSTSDLFPEADLLFDSNHSPSYDQSGQKIQGAEAKAKEALHLFSDDENSGPLRNDLFDYVEYHPPESGVDQMNGNNVSTESISSCDDTTLLSNCGSMSEVTLNSPISPEYSDNSYAVNKYKYKYTNRKKGEKIIKLQPENWQEVSEVTSSEDALELMKEDETPIAVQEETVIDEAIAEVETVVREHSKYSDEDVSMRCPVHSTAFDSRSSRKSVKRVCSCFNGSKNQNAMHVKKRLSSPKSHGPSLSKKPSVSKKR